MINIVIVKNPFKTDKEVKQVEYVPNQPVFAYIQPDFMGEEVVISLNGEIVPEDGYQTTVPDQNDYIAVCPVVQGGGGDGKDIGRTLATIALTIVTMGAGSLAAGGAFMGSGAIASANWGFWSWVAATGTYMAGGYLINRWFPIGQGQSDTERKQTYSWSQQSPIEMEGQAIPITFGTVRMGVMAPIQTLTRHVTTDGEKQYLNMLMCGGEGPIDSISNLTINGNPYSNYDGVSYENRLGTNDQSVISNFNDTYFPKAVSNELKEGASPSVNQLNGDYEGLEVTLNFPSGLYHVDGDGNTESNQVIIELKYRLVGSSTWVDWGTKTISGKYTHAIRRIYKKHELPKGQYEVSVQCTNIDHSKDEDGHKVYWTSLSGIIYDDFIYPNKVLVGLKALATDQLSGGMPKIQWTQTRSHVWVWNPNTSQYEQKPANNPAWASYDLIHRCRYLKNINNGSKEYVVYGVPAARIDYQAFENWATFCSNRGITYDGIIYQTKTLWESLKEPEQAGRGRVLMKGTRFSCVCDAPGDPVQLFNVSNMEIDNFEEEFLGNKDRANALELTFYNIDNNYKKSTIPIYGSDYDKETVIENPTQVSLDFAMTLDQAYKYGAYQLRVNNYINRTISWSADIDAIACEVGDVVLVQHDVPRWGTGGRIVSATTDTVTLDQEVTLEPNTDYSIMVRLQNDTLVTKAVQAVSTETTTDKLTLTTSFTDIPQKNDIFSFGEVDKVAKPFRLTSVSREGDFRCKLQATEYIDELYNEATNIPTIDYTQSTGEVSDINITQYLEDYNAMLGISWNPPDVLYEGARVKIDGELVGRVGSNESSLDCSINYIPAGTQISVTIEALDIFGNLIDEATAYYTVQSKMTTPKDVSWENCSFEETIILNCSKIDDYNFAGYEFRTDTNFGSEDTNLIYRGDDPTFEIKKPDQRTYTFYVKGFNQEMDYSANYDSVTLSNSAPAAPNLTGDDITEFFSAVKIHVPSVNGATEYNVYITPSDGAGNATGSTEVIPLSTAQTITYNLNSGDSILIKIGSRDSLTTVMNDENVSAEIEATAATIDDIAEFAASLRPPEIVDSKPTLPNADYPEGSTILLSTDSTLWKNVSGGWTDQLGRNEYANILVGALKAGAITSDQIASNEIIARHIGSNEIITHSANIKDAIIDTAKIVDAAITDAKIDSLSASKIVAGILTLTGNMKVQSENSSTYIDANGITVSGSPAENLGQTADWSQVSNDDGSKPEDVQRKSKSISTTGWYRIAMNTGNRAYAKFKVYDPSSGDHNLAVFTLGCNYNREANASFSLLNYTQYGGWNLQKVRLLTNGTYDDMYVDVYLGGSVNSTIKVEITENIQNSGWIIQPLDSATIPSGYTSTEWNLKQENVVQPNNFDEFEGTAAGGSVTIGSNGIKATDAQGDYSLLNADHLAFFKAGSNIPHWYSKRVAYGVAQDGDYINLGWDKDPKVLTAIKQLQTYTANSNADDQTYTSYADAISKDGFYVYGKSIILDSASKLTHNVAYNLGIGGSWTSVDSQSQTTDLELTISATTEITQDDPGGSIRQLDIDYSIYYITSSGARILYKSGNFYKYVNDTNYDNKTVSKTYNITSLPPDAYNLEVVIDNYRYGQDFTINQWIEWANTVVDNGEVMWIAVEGGA